MKAYDPQINTIFVVLGFLGDYMGRIVRQGKNLIEEFYPHENEIAAEFETHLHNLIAEQNLKTTITQEIGPQGHIALLSPEIATLLNSYHVFRLFQEISAVEDKYACQSVAWKVYPRNIPVGHAIIFEPSDELARFLGISPTGK